MNKKKQDLVELIDKLEDRLVVMALIKKVIKACYSIFSISAITTMIISIFFNVSNIYILAFWLLFAVFALFFIEKAINNTEPSLKNNIKYLKDYSSNFEGENNKNKK